MELTNMKAVELKEMAKASGVKGYYKMNKLQLISALLNNELTNEVVGGDVQMNNTVVNNNEVIAVNNMEGGVKMERRLSIKELIAKGSVEAIVERVSRKNNAAFKMIKQESKNMKVVGGFQIIASAQTVELNGKGYPELCLEVAVNVSLESSLTRAASTKYMKVADRGMVLELEGTTEVVSINLDDSLFREGKAYEAIRTRFFRMLKRGKAGRILRESINLVVNNKSGLARIELDANAELTQDEVMKQIKVLGVTPSGLRSKSLAGASVMVRTKDATIEADRRTNLLNESIDGCVDAYLNEDGSFRSLKNKAEQFKSSTRITMGTPGSKVVGAVDNYIVFNNIAEGCTFIDLKGQVKPADTTCDGNQLLAAEWYHAKLVTAGIPVSLYDVVGITDQLRGAGLKCSGTYETKEDLVTVARHLLSRNSAAKVAYVVVDGVRYKTWEEVVAAGVAGQLFNNLEMIADTNAMKLQAHYNRFEIVRLKMAYQSDMNLSMVTAMAMLVTNEAKAKEVLLDKGIKGLVKKFAQIGVKFEYADGMINGVELDLEGMKSLNNESQFMTYLLKCDPEMTMKMFPGVVRSELANMIKGIAKAISKTEFELDNSKYTVVQADKAVLYGKQILAENEIFCNTLDANVEVAITRHPISALEAVTVLKSVSLTEVVERILAFDISIDQKLMLVNYYGRANQWCIIPASHRLMEKHDGMDFDIDAGQIIADEDVVDILKEMDDRGSVIRDNIEANAARMTETAEEAAIAKTQKKPAIGFTRPRNIVKERTTEGKRVRRVNIQSVQATSNIDLSFDSVASMSEDYFATTIASVGVIANAFYVNGLTLATLKSTTIDMETKNNIVKAFKKYYGCNGATQYTSKVDRAANSYEVDKFDCTAAVFAYAESNGTIDSLIAYLEDCCDYNRYLAETSIDSAKNNYYIINMFNHSKIVATKGAKQNCKAALVQADATFAEIAEDLGLTQNNYFKIDLLQFESKGLDMEAWVECDGEELNEFTGEMEQVPMAVEDPLYIIKEELREVTNELIVTASKQIETVVTSEDAVELRKEVIAYASTIVDAKAKGMAPSIDSIKKTYSTLTLGLKENDTNDGEKTSDEIEGISKVEYLKTVAVNGIKNFKRHAFADLNSLELGALVCADLISTISEDSCGTINAALYKVCEAEMIEFLADFGVSNVGFIGEAISYAELDNKKVKVDAFVGTNVTVVEGSAELEDGTVLTMKDRRADLTGTVVDMDGHFYVKAVKEVEQVNDEDGLYININKAFDKYCVDMDKFEAVSYRFEATYQVNKSTKAYLAVVGTNAEGQDGLIACLSGRNDLTELLKKTNLDNISVFAHTNKNENTTRALFIPGADYVEAMNKEEAVDEFGDFNFGAPVDMTPQEENTEDLFGGFNFGEPV